MKAGGIVARQQLGVLVADEGVALTAVLRQHKTIYQTTDINAFQQTANDLLNQLKGDVDV